MDGSENSAGGKPLRPDVVAGLKVLVSTFEALSFFVVVYVLGIVSGILEQFMFVWLVEIGGTGTVRAYGAQKSDLSSLHVLLPPPDSVGVHDCGACPYARSGRPTRWGATSCRMAAPLTYCWRPSSPSHQAHHSNMGSETWTVLTGGVCIYVYPHRHPGDGRVAAHHVRS